MSDGDRPDPELEVAVARCDELVREIAALRAARVRPPAAPTAGRMRRWLVTLGVATAMVGVTVAWMIAYTWHERPEVDGALVVEEPTGTWTFAPGRCVDGLARDLIGVELFDRTALDRSLLINGYEDPVGITLVTGSRSLRLDACARRSGRMVPSDTDRHWDGSIDIDCTGPGGEHVHGALAFQACY